MTTKAATKTDTVEIPALKIGNLHVTIAGTTRLVTHRFAQKTIIEMLGRHMKFPTLGDKEAKDPVELFISGTYPMCGVKPIVHGKFSFEMVEEILFNAGNENANGEGGSLKVIWAEGQFGFPANGIKAAIVRAGTDAGLNMTDLRRQILIPGELIEIQCEPGPRMRCDMVRISNTSTDIRFRPEFYPWKMTIPIKYNKASRTRDQIINLIRMAGFGVGLGEWRPSGKTTSGTWGTFQISTVEEHPDDFE